MIEAYYGFLSSVFAPILALPNYIAVMIISILVTLIITFIRKKTIDQVKFKEIKDQMKEKQKKAKEFQKEDPKKANEEMNEMMKLSNKMMGMNMKPMIYIMAFALLFLPWVASMFTGAVVNLPFNSPFSGQPSFGWLAWYIIISMPATQVFNKLLGVES